MFVFLIFSLILNVILLLFCFKFVKILKSVKNLLKLYNLDLKKIDFEFWNNFEVGEVNPVGKE